MNKQSPLSLVSYKALYLCPSDVMSSFDCPSDVMSSLFIFLSNLAFVHGVGFCQLAFSIYLPIYMYFSKPLESSLNRLLSIQQHCLDHDWMPNDCLKPSFLVFCGLEMPLPYRNVFHQSCISQRESARRIQGQQVQIPSQNKCITLLKA